MPDSVRADNFARLAVVRTLAHVRDPRGVEILLTLLGDEGFLFTADQDVVVGDLAATVLASLSGEQYGRDRDAWTAWWARVGRQLPPATQR